MLVFGLYCGALAVMTEADVADMVGYLIGAFGLGVASAAILRIFRKAVEVAR